MTQRDQSQLAYCQTVGTQNTNYAIIEQRDPTANDIYYPLGKFWINQPDDKLWYLNSQSNSTGVLQSEWLLISVAASTLISLSDDSNTVVTASGSGDTPPFNIQLVGGTGIDVTAGPGAHEMTITNTGAAATETLTGDDSLVVSPTADNINLFGSTVLSGTNTKPVYFKRKTATTDTAELDVQVTKTSTSGAKSINNAGLASFDSSSFSVDATTGFVTFIGSGTGIQNIIPDSGSTLSGTSINLNGDAPFASGTTNNALTISGTDATHGKITLQFAGSNSGSSSANRFGIAQFDSNQFSVTGGFVQLSGGTTPAIEKVGLDTGTTTIQPTASKINILGAVVAAGVNPIRTDGTASDTATIEVQKSQAILAADATKIGLSNYSSAQFTVDPNAFVQLKGGTGAAILNIPVPNGTTPVVPNGTGAVSFTSSGGTITITGGTNTINFDESGVNTARPAFLAYLNTTDSNVTGNNTTYTLGSGNALTEVFDQGNNFNTNGTFTAPTTGKYNLQYQNGFGGLTNLMTQESLRIVTSNKTFNNSLINSGTARTSNNTLNMNGSVLCEMDAGDTANFIAIISFGAADSANSLGTTAGIIRTYVCGNLVC